MIDRPDVIGISAFLADLRDGRYDAAGQHRVVIGQGVNREAYSVIAAERDRRRLGDRLTIAGRGRDPVPHTLVHKQRPENVLLAGVQRLGPQHFQADLAIGEHNELVLDHLSGYHISGMVMKEASRQMILAVTETFYRAGGPLSYVLRSWSTTFDRFLFPVDATVAYAVDRLEARRPDRFDFGVAVEIHQYGRRAARCVIEFLACDGARLTSLERRQADETIDAVLRTPEAVLR
jgi:hypothetical protein